MASSLALLEAPESDGRRFKYLAVNPVVVAAAVETDARRSATIQL